MLSKVFIKPKQALGYRGFALGVLGFRGFEFGFSRFGVFRGSTFRVLGFLWGFGVSHFGFGVFGVSIGGSGFRVSRFGVSGLGIKGVIMCCFREKLERVALQSLH